MKNPYTNKDGAALVIAIGFLAILTIIIVAFSVQTRTERLAGREFLVSAQTRHLLNTALARALEDIDTEVNRSTYPEFLALGSPREGNTEPYLTDSLDFAIEEDYIPGTNSPIHARYLDVLNNEAQWETVTDPGGTILGRIGYIVLNTSGLLDANTVGGEPRGAGLSPHEIQLSPEIIGELSINTPPLDFASKRDSNWRRFESLRDVWKLNSLPGMFILTKQPESFSTFSLFPNDGTTRTPLTTDMNQAVFINKLLASGLDGKQAEAVYKNYLDYVDADSVPNDLASSSTEAVPMINEIWIEDFQFSQDASDATNITYTMSGDLFVETWQPFDTPYPGSFVLNLFAADPGITNAFGKGFPGDNDYITITATYSNNITSFILELIDYSEETSGTDFRTFHYTFSFDDSVQLKSPFDAEEEVPLPLSLSASEDKIEVVVDKTPRDRVENIGFGWDFIENDTKTNDYASCIDPRVNFDFSDLAQWTNGVPSSPNAINGIKEWGEETDLANKSDIRFHVRNGPMTHAAELGFLSIGKPWRTVRLYASDDPDYPLNPVLDQFNADEPLWNAINRPGLVNINSSHSNVLAAAFFNAPIQRHPGEENPAERVSTSQALRLGANLAALTDGDPQRDLSFVGNALSNNVPNWTTLTDAQKESIVANSYRLFGWRDNLFTIILAAQKISNDETQSTQKAVAYVWRDPVTRQTACVFYGLSSTLQSSIGSGPSWSDILIDFKP